MSMAATRRMSSRNAVSTAPWRSCRSQTGMAASMRTLHPSSSLLTAISPTREPGSMASKRRRRALRRAGTESRAVPSGTANSMTCGPSPGETCR